MSDVVLSIWRGALQRPSHLRFAIERIAGEEAARRGVPLAALLGFGKSADVVEARRAAMARALDAANGNVTELARVWGCSRRTIQRTLGVARFEFAKVAAE